MSHRTHATAFRRGRLTLLLLSSFVLFSGALTGQSADEESLRGHLDRLIEAFNAQDLETAFSFYADDIVRIPPDAPVIVGLDAFREAAGGDQEGEYILDEYEVRRVDVSGDLGYMLITYSEHFTPSGGGEAIPSSGRWATMWRRQDDGSWKMTAEIWNLDPEDG